MNRFLPRKTLIHKQQRRRLKERAGIMSMKIRSTSVLSGAPEWGQSGGSHTTIVSLISQDRAEMEMYTPLYSGI